MPWYLAQEMLGILIHAQEYLKPGHMCPKTCGLILLTAYDGYKRDHVTIGHVCDAFITFVFKVLNKVIRKSTVSVNRVRLELLCFEFFQVF